METIFSVDKFALCCYISCMPPKGHKKLDSRTYMLRIRLTEAEHQKLLRAARKTYQGLSTWVRDVAISAAETQKRRGRSSG